MKKLKGILFSKPVLIIGACLLVVAIIFFDNIRGYYRFKKLCAEHKELVVYQKLEPNLGWQANLNEYENSDSVNELLYFMPKIKFYRFKDYTKRQLYDAKFIGVSSSSLRRFNSPYISEDARKALKEDKNYEYRLANSEIKPTYQLENFSESIPNETRMSRGGYRIRDLRTNQIVVRLEEIGYSTFDRNHTLLDAPSGNTCRVAPSFYSTNIQNKIFAN